MHEPSRTAQPVLPLPVEDLDRKLKWRFVPIVVFVGTMVTLTAMAIGALRPPPPTEGLPRDPDAIAARALVLGEGRVETAPYLYRSEFLGLPDGAHALYEPERLGRADSLLRAALARRPVDARIYAALASLDLARGRLRHAEAGFRRATELAAHYPDARIGLGVTLALRADRSDDPFEQRRLRLRAIAQLFDVRPGYPGETVALYDRAWLGHLSGRQDQARRDAARFLTLDPGSPLAPEAERLVSPSQHGRFGPESPNR